MQDKSSVNRIVMVKSHLKKWREENPKVQVFPKSLKEMIQNLRDQYTVSTIAKELELNETRIYKWGPKSNFKKDQRVIKQEEIISTKRAPCNQISSDGYTRFDVSVSDDRKAIVPCFEIEHRDFIVRVFSPAEDPDRMIGIFHKLMERAS